jgi:large subunit ribosomal protein L10
LASREQKKQAIIDITDRLGRAQSVVIVEYAGLNVSKITDLRAKLRESGVEMKVFKNTLAKRAVAEQGVVELKKYLEGPTAGVFSMQDPVSGPKILIDFAKKNKQLIIKGGALENKIIDADGVKTLADLPSREVLLTQVVMGMQGPLSGMVNVLQGPLRKFVYALEALKKEREQA